MVQPRLERQALIQWWQDHPHERASTAAALFDVPHTYARRARVWAGVTRQRNAETKARHLEYVRQHATERAQDVARELGTSESYVYQLRKELGLTQVSKTIPMLSRAQLVQYLQKEVDGEVIDPGVAAQLALYHRHPALYLQGIEDRSVRTLAGLRAKDHQQQLQ
jgi:hypothetical protein